MTEAPRHRLLDIVELDVEPADAGFERLCVSSVRRYVNGRYGYGLGGLDDQNDERARLYDEEQLRPTGKRSELGEFAVPGRFKHRDLVAVSGSYDPHVAGLTGEVEGWQEPFEDMPLLISVWFAELEEVVLLPEDVLTATGRQAASAVHDRPALMIQCELPHVGMAAKAAFCARKLAFDLGARQQFARGDRAGWADAHRGRP